MEIRYEYIENLVKENPNNAQKNLSENRPNQEEMNYMQFLLTKLKDGDTSSNLRDEFKNKGGVKDQTTDYNKQDSEVKEVAKEHLIPKPPPTQKAPEE